MFKTFVSLLSRHALYLTLRPRTGAGTSRYMVIVNHSSILFAKVFKIFRVYHPLLIIFHIYYCVKLLITASNSHAVHLDCLCHHKSAVLL